MKPLCLLTFLLLTTTIFAQEFKVSATSQTWAGGICCRHGINYSVTVKTGKSDIDSIKVLSVCMDKKRFTNSSLTMIKYKNSFTVSFGYDIDDHKYITDEYIPQNDNQKPCTENLVIFKLNGEIFSLKIEQVEQLFPLAYP